MQPQPGDIYWVPIDGPHATPSDIIHPHVVIQTDDPPHPAKIIVCRVTTNMKQVNAPGNVVLDVGEANLPKRSIVVVSQIAMVDPSQFGAYIGTLSEKRMAQILAGMRFVRWITGMQVPVEKM